MKKQNANNSGDTHAPASPAQSNGAIQRDHSNIAIKLAKLGEEFRNAYSDLKKTTDTIQVAHKKSVGEAIRCGRLLNEAKDLVGHGNWLNWLKKHAQISTKTANRYMKLVKNHSALGDTEGKSLVDCYNALGLIKKAKISTSPDQKEPSEFLQAKKLVLRLAELLNKTTDEKRMAEIIQPTIAWHNKYLAKMQKIQEAAELDKEFGIAA